MRWTALTLFSLGIALGACADRTQPLACDGEAATCSTQNQTGECVDAVDETDAECDGDGWVCPEGYFLASEVSCEWPTYCDGAAPTCTDQAVSGDCSDAVEEVSADCVEDQYVCPPGFHTPDEIHCEWPTYCDGEPPICTDQQVSGECVDATWEEPAECVGDEYVCPPGFHFPEEIHCEPPSWCEGDAPTCFEGGSCNGATQPAFCNLDTWTCEPGFEIECGHPCDGGEPAPDECWDQGPGECSDTTQPAWCTDGFWTCPPGWDFGGFGEACEWP